MSNKYIINDELINQIDKEAITWREFLNNGIGILSFTLALSSLGTPHPTVTALASLLFIFLIYLTGLHLFPKTIVGLRKEAKQDSKAKILLKGIENRIFNLKTFLLKFSVFAYGLSSLVLVLIKGVW